MAGTPGFGLREDALQAAYFLFGEEDYIAEEFVGELERVLGAASGGELHLARFDLDEAKWREVVDAARTAPFLFEPWRALVVRIPEPKPGGDRGSDRRSAPGAECRGPKHLSSLDQKILKEYFAEPPSRTVLVVIRAGRVRRDDAIVRFFTSLPKTAVRVEEMKRLPEYRLAQRAEEEARALGKTLTQEAKKRLFELLGQDLRLTVNEVRKLAIFVGDKKGIDERDVDVATAGRRSFQSYDFDDALAAADFAKAAAILDEMFGEGERSEVIVGRLAGFFRNVLAAQTWLREKSRTKDDIFQAFFPSIPKSWPEKYREKYGNFFGIVEGLGPDDLDALLVKLRELDRTLKTTGVKGTEEKILFETFLREFCVARKKRTIISLPWD